MAHPRYAPSGVLKLSLTRIITSTAMAAAAVLVCGPALESAGHSTAAASVSQSGFASTGQDGSEPGGYAAGGSTAPPPSSAVWRGAIPIRPSKFPTLTPEAEKPGVVAEPAVFGPAGETGALGIPAMVLRAYHQAADRLAVEDASCKLPWWLLAGIGHTESGHAEDGRLAADGTTRGKILGPRLNGGIPGDAVISDTDHGAYDGDTVYDRAIGPMQFIPSAWLRWGADGNADGKRDPSNIFDATRRWPPGATCAPTAVTCPLRPACRPRSSATTTRTLTSRRCWPGGPPTAAAPRRSMTACSRSSAT